MRTAILALLALPAASPAQYIYPTPEENRSEPGLYVEDPFIVEYRKKFFAVFRGDLQTFSQAYDEVAAMVDRDPSDARALVWRGNGRMVKAGIALFQNDREQAQALLEGCHLDLDAAVGLAPEDPNIYMMRAATLLLIQQRFPEGWSSRSLYERLERDSHKFLGHIGWRRLPRTSIHLRGEALASLAIAQRELGRHEESLVNWRRLEMLNRGTRYEAKAREDAELTRQRRDQARSAGPTGR